VKRPVWAPEYKSELFDAKYRFANRPPSVPLQPKLFNLAIDKADFVGFRRTVYESGEPRIESEFAGPMGCCGLANVAELQAPVIPVLEEKEQPPLMIDEVSHFLRRPLFVPNDVNTQRDRFVTGHESAEKKISRDAMKVPSTRDGWIDLIRDTFSSQPSKLEDFVHPVDKRRRAKKVYSVVPSTEMMCNKYMQVKYLDETVTPKPAADVPPSVLRQHIEEDVPDTLALFEASDGTYAFKRLYKWDNKSVVHQHERHHTAPYTMLRFSESNLEWCHLSSRSFLMKAKAKDAAAAGKILGSLSIKTRPFSETELFRREKLRRMVGDPDYIPDASLVT